MEHLAWDGIPPRHAFPLPVFQLRFAEWWQTLLRDLAEVAADERP